MSAWELAAFALGFLALGFCVGVLWYRATLPTRMARIGASEMALIAGEAITRVERATRRRQRRLLGAQHGRHLAGRPVKPKAELELHPSEKESRKL